MNKYLIASELTSLGFTTRITQTGVLVSLNRLVSKMEIETALEQIFEITFKIDQVEIGWDKTSFLVSEK